MAIKPERYRPEHLENVLASPFRFGFVSGHCKLVFATLVN